MNRNLIEVKFKGTIRQVTLTEKSWLGNSVHHDTEQDQRAAT